MAKGKKMDFQKAAMRVLIIGGTGAVAQVVTEALGATNQDYVDYGVIGLGIILPELVKGNEMVSDASDALLAVGAYKLAEKLDISGKLGITKATTAATTVTGLNDYRSVGNTQGWSPKRTYQAQKVNGPGKAESTGSAVK